VTLMVDLLYSGLGFCSLENFYKLNNLLNSLGFIQLLSRVEKVLNVLEVSEEEDDIVFVDKEVLDVLEVSESEEEYNDALDILQDSADEDHVSEASYLKRNDLKFTEAENQHRQMDFKLSRQRTRVKKVLKVSEEEDDIVLAGRRKRKRKHQKCSPKDLSSRQVIHGHNNIIWAGEDIESYEDVDVSWVMKKMELDLQQFIDVSDGEKSFFCSWNKFLIDYKPGVSIVHLKTVLEEFVDKWGMEVMESQLYKEFVTHLVWLEQSCLISEQTLLNTVMRFQRLGSFSNVGS